MLPLCLQQKRNCVVIGSQGTLSEGEEEMGSEWFSGVGDMVLKLVVNFRSALELMRMISMIQL